MGQNCWANDVKIRRKRTPSLPRHESICPEVSSKARAVENCRYTIVPIWTRLQLIFAQLLLWISSVFTEESQKCVKNMNLFMIERGNPLWVDSRVPHLCQASSRQKCLWIMMIVLTKIFYLQRYRKRIEKLSQRDRLSKFCIDAGFLNVVDDKRYCIIDTVHRCSGLSWVHFAKRWRNVWTERLDQREHQNWARIGSYNLFACKVNLKLRSELCL